MTVRAAIGLAIAALALAPAPAAAENAGDAVAGKRLADDLCAECHAVRPEQFIIPNVDASHFADVANTPGITALALRVSLQSTHDKMPNIILTAQQTDDVIAYILSLKGK